AETDTDYWRIANFLFPFYAMVPTGVLGLEIRVRAWVPMDDEHTLAITVARSPQGTRSAGRQVVSPPRTLPNTSDWYGRFRCVANAANDYQIDRQAQKTVSYTGIDAIFLQDQAVTESMGPIYDRTNERLGSSDAMIIRTRKRLIDAAKALRDSGKAPPGVDDPSVYAVRSGGAVLPRGADWIEATRELRRAGVTHRGLTRDVLGGLPAGQPPAVRGTTATLGRARRSRPGPRRRRPSRAASRARGSRRERDRWPTVPDRSRGRRRCARSRRWSPADASRRASCGARR